MVDILFLDPRLKKALKNLSLLKIESEIKKKIIEKGNCKPP